LTLSNVSQIFTKLYSKNRAGFVLDNNVSILHNDETIKKNGIRTNKQVKYKNKSATDSCLVTPCFHPDAK